MKISLLLAAAFLLSAGTASAYSHSITNSSKVRARFGANYKACSGDSWDLKPGETITWRSGLCCINKVSASADFASTVNGRPRVPGMTEDFWGKQVFDLIGLGSFFNILCTNTNWKLTVDMPETEGGDTGYVHLQRL